VHAGSRRDWSLGFGDRHRAILLASSAMVIPLPFAYRRVEIRVIFTLSDCHFFREIKLVD
jgi:hypothetical protein